MNDFKEPEELARDPLGARLSALETAPPTSTLLPRVLAGAHAMRVRPWRRFQGAAVLAAALAVLVVAGAATPMTRNYIGGLFQQMNVVQPAAALASVTAHGRTITALSGVDDGQVVLLNLHATGSGAFRDFSEVDAGGQPLKVYGARGSDDFLLLSKRPDDGVRPGTPITVHVTGAGGETWTLRVIIHASSPPTARPVPAGGTLGPLGVTFTGVRASDHYILVTADVTGRDEFSVLDTLGKAALTAPGGQLIASVWNQGTEDKLPDGQVRVHAEWYWPRQGSGDYRLTLGDGGATLTRTLPIT